MAGRHGNTGSSTPLSSWPGSCMLSSASALSPSGGWGGSRPRSSQNLLNCKHSVQLLWFSLLLWMVDYPVILSV